MPIPHCWKSRGRAQIFMLSFTHKAPAKIHLKMSSVEVICCICLLTLLSNVNLDANSVHQDQTVHLGLHSPTLFVERDV